MRNQTPCDTIRPNWIIIEVSMKAMIYGCILWVSLLSASYAFTVDELPNELYLTQHWVSYTTSFDIETKTKKLGTLYRRILSLALTYDFYDSRYYYKIKNTEFFLGVMVLKK